MRWVLSIHYRSRNLVGCNRRPSRDNELRGRSARSLENAVMTRIKYWRVGGKSMSNPTPDSPDTVKEGADHFSITAKYVTAWMAKTPEFPSQLALSIAIASLKRIAAELRRSRSVPANGSQLRTITQQELT